jgi:hypothetical protein
MWKCTKCTTVNEEYKRRCISCSEIKSNRTPIIITIANVICSLNIIGLISWGIINSANISEWFWIGIVIYFVANFGLWKMKRWGLYAYFAMIAFLFFTFGYANLEFSPHVAFICLIIYVSKNAWFD